jgi:hypothetical protein
MKLNAQCLFMFGLISFMACGQKHAHSDADKDQSSIQLNDGKPWTANPETTAGIEALQSLVAQMPSSSEQADCQKLKSELKTEFDNIIKQCTMEGEAHNQLHNYLMPLAEEIDQLDAGANSSCQVQVKTVRQTLGEYTTYFK